MMLRRNKTKPWRKEEKSMYTPITLHFRSQFY